MIVSLGDVLVDIVSLIDGPISYGTDTFVRISITPGGSAANFSTWVSRLGAEAAFIGKVGDDVFGRYLREDLLAEGVAASLATGSEATGINQALVDHLGERTMLAADRGASATLDVADLDWRLLDKARLLHLTTYSFVTTPCCEAALAAIRRVGGHGGMISLDASAYSVLRELGASRFRELTQGVHILFANIEEGKELTGEPEPDGILHALAETCEVVALKLGAEGAMATAHGEKATCPAPSVDAIDTTGAGDAFAAAFVVKWLATRNLPASLAAAVALASEVVQKPGARPHVNLKSKG